MLPAWPWWPAVDTTTMMLPRRVFDHEAGDVLGAEEGTGEIHGELAVPALELHLEHALAAEDAGVVDEDVDAAADLARAGDHGLDLALVGDVARDPQCVATVPTDRLRTPHLGLPSEGPTIIVATYPVNRRPRRRWTADALAYARRRRVDPARRARLRATGHGPIVAAAGAGRAGPRLRPRHHAVPPVHGQRGRPATVRSRAGQRHRGGLPERDAGHLHPLPREPAARRACGAERPRARDVRHLRVPARHLCRRLSLPLASHPGQPRGPELAQPLSHRGR